MNDKQIDRAELRRLAEDCQRKQHPFYNSKNEQREAEKSVKRLNSAAHSTAILELLDHVESLKKANSELATAAIEKPPYKQDILARLTAAEAVCYSLFSDCCEWQVDVDALKAWKEKYEEIYLDEYERKAKEGSMDE